MFGVLPAEVEGEACGLKFEVAVLTLGHLSPLFLLLLVLLLLLLLLLLVFLLVLLLLFVVLLFLLLQWTGLRLRRRRWRLQPCTVSALVLVLLRPLA